MTRAEAGREWSDLVDRLESTLTAISADATWVRGASFVAAEAAADLEANARTAAKLLTRMREVVAALVASGD